MSVTRYEGIEFGVKVLKSNRYRDRIEIYEFFESDSGNSFPFSEDFEKEIENASSQKEIDDVVVKFYKGKRGERVYDTEY